MATKTKKPIGHLEITTETVDKEITRLENKMLRSMIWYMRSSCSVGVTQIGLTLGLDIPEAYREKVRVADDEKPCEIMQIHLNDKDQLFVTDTTGATTLVQRGQYSTNDLRQLLCAIEKTTTG